MQRKKIELEPKRPNFFQNFGISFEEKWVPIISILFELFREGGFYDESLFFAQKYLIFSKTKQFTVEILSLIRRFETKALW